MPYAVPLPRRVLATLAAGVAGALLPASTASATSAAGAAPADVPGPSDHRSTITDVRPPSDGFDLAVTGGDAFLELRAEPSHEVVVLGYDDEPYLRFGPDGTVEANRESPATYVNTTMSGTADVPAGVDPDDPPRWTTVADGGTYAWHDHRVHWMGSQRPPGVERGGEIQRWTVPLRVDDRPVTVEGVLTLAAAPTWWPWPVAVAALAAALWVLGRRRPRAAATLATATAGMACAVAVAVAAVEQLSLPAEAGRRWLPVLVPAVGAVAALVVLAGSPLRRRPVAARNLGLAAAAAAAGWAVLRLAVLTRPVLVTELPPNLDRGGTAAALGLAVGAAALLVLPSRDDAPIAPDAADQPADTPDTQSAVATT